MSETVRRFLHLLMLWGRSVSGRGAALSVVVNPADGDAHRFHRTPYDPPLRLRPVRQNYTELVESVATSFVDALPSGGSFDLRPGLANPLAVTVAGRILGISFGDIRRIGEIYDAFASSMVDYADPDPEATTAPARDEFDALVARSIERIRSAPDASLISTVVSAEQPLHSDDELIANIRVLLFGAVETVTSSILNTVWSLLTHPAELAEALADPSLFAGAVDEALRLISPVGFSERWAAVDTELAGVEILRGEMMIPSIASANRDPELFPDPDAFDIHRPNARHHMAFSRGEHHCIGFNVANLEARIAVERLFARFPDLRLDHDRPSAPSGFGFRSLRTLHVVAA